MLRFARFARFHIRTRPGVRALKTTATKLRYPFGHMSKNHLQGPVDHGDYRDAATAKPRESRAHVQGPKSTGTKLQYPHGFVVRDHVRRFWTGPQDVKSKKEVAADQVVVNVNADKTLTDVPKSAAAQFFGRGALTIDAVNKDKGLSDFLRRTYMFSGAGLVGTLGAASLLAPFMADAAILPIFGTGMVLSIGGAVGIGMSKYFVKENQLVIKDTTSTVKQVFYMSSHNSPARLASFGALSAGMGMVLAPMVSFLPPTILPASLAITSCIFGGSSLYAYFRPKGSLLKYEAPLMGCLLGLVGIQVLGLVSTFIMGPNPLSMAIHSVDTYGGIVLFTAMTAFDTQKAINMYEKKDPDHLGCSVNLYLDFINILVRVMEIMAKAQQKR